jgi:arylsulfatase A-like enzyme
MGPGVRKGFEIKVPISHVDQVPTLLSLIGVKVPDYVQGRVLKEIME